MNQINQYEEQEEECPHSYEFIEMLDSVEPDAYRELWGCIFCAHERVLNKSVGVRD